MKTIRRKLDEIGGIELNNKQKLFLKGGDEGGGGTCAFKDPEGFVQCDLSRWEAEVFFYGPYGPGSGANWCCDSCPGTGWWIETCGGTISEIQ